MCSDDDALNFQDFVGESWHAPTIQDDPGILDHESFSSFYLYQVYYVLLQ